MQSFGLGRLLYLKPFYSQHFPVSQLETLLSSALPAGLRQFQSRCGILQMSISAISGASSGPPPFHRTPIRNAESPHIHLSHLRGH